MAELVHKLALDKGWVSRTVEGLTREGLLIKRASETDRRTILLSLSPAGQQRYLELNVSLNDLSDRVVYRISPTEDHNVVHALELLRHALFR